MSETGILHWQQTSAHLSAAAASAQSALISAMSGEDLLEHKKGVIFFDNTVEKMVGLLEHLERPDTDIIGTIPLNLELFDFSRATIAELEDPRNIVLWNKKHSSRCGGSIDVIQAWMALQIALQLDLPRGEHFVFAMEPVVIDDVPYVFAIVRDIDGCLWVFADKTTKRIEADTKVICRFRAGHIVR